MASTRLGYLAIKKETTTAVAVKPSHFLRFKDGDIEVEKEVIPNNPIMNNRWNAICPVEGKTTTEGTYNFDLDVNEGVHFLYGALGSISTSDIGSTPTEVYQHTITIANSLPSFTLEQGKGNLSDTSNYRQNYQVDRGYGVMVDTLTLSGSDSICNMEVALKAHGVFQRSLLISNATAGSSVNLYLESVEGLTTSDTVNIYDTTPQAEQDLIVSISTSAKTIQIATLGNSYTIVNNAKVELTPQTPSYGACKVTSFTNCSFQFGTDLTAAASATEENIEDWTFEYMNNLEERFGSLRSSPSVIAPKGAGAKLTFKKYFENVLDRDRYLARIKRSGILTITTNEIVGVTDTNQYKYTIKIEMSDIRFSSYNMPTGTDELYGIEAECECFYDSTDGRAIRFIITNSKAGSEYTA